MAMNALKNAKNFFAFDDDDEEEEEEERVDEEKGGTMWVTAGKSVPLQFVVEKLGNDVAQSDLYSDLLVYIPFVVMFIFFFLFGRAIEQNHLASSATKMLTIGNPYPGEEETYVAVQNFMADNPNYAETGIKPSIGDDEYYKDIRRDQDWHAWFRDVLIPNTWDCENPTYSRSFFAKRGQLQFVGAMRIRAQLMQNTSCAPDGNIVPFFNETACFSAHRSSGEITHPWCHKPNPAKPTDMLWAYQPNTRGSWTTADIGLYHTGGYVAQLPFNATCQQVYEFADLIAQPDCNPANDTTTRLIMVEWFQYSSNMDTFLMAKLIMEVSEGGAWVPNWQFRMFPVWTKKRLGMTIFDFFFFVFVLYYLAKLVYDWVKHYKATKRFLSFCFDVWNVLELTNMITFIAVLALRWSWWTQSQKEDVSYPFLDVYPQQLDPLALLFAQQIYANSINIVITFMKLLKFVRLEPRLSILTRSLDKSQQGLFGVLSLFVFLVFGYAITGAALFGSNVLQFRNMNTSFSSLMFMLLGQFDYPAMRKEQRTFAGMYFFSFIILASFLLLNFIIAIISEGFAQESHKHHLEPLADVIVRKIGKLKDVFSVRNFRKILELRFQKKSRTGLLKETLRYLNEHIDLIEQQTPEALDQDIPMYKGDLKHWLPESLYADLGEFYVDRLWDDFEHEFEIESSSPEYQARRDMEVAIQSGVGKAIGERLADADTLDAQMSEIELLISRVVSAVMDM